MISQFGSHNVHHQLLLFFLAMFGLVVSTEFFIFLDSISIITLSVSNAYAVALINLSSWHHRENRCSCELHDEFNYSNIFSLLTA